jgi:hypothetical protein
VQRQACLRLPFASPMQGHLGTLACCNSFGRRLWNITKYFASGFASINLRRSVELICAAAWKRSGAQEKRCSSASSHAEESRSRVCDGDGNWR